MSPHKPSDTSHTSTSKQKQPFWHGGIRSALSSAISIFQPSASRPRPPVQTQAQAQAQDQDRDQQQENHQPQDQPQEQTTGPKHTIPIPMSSSTPGGDPTHSTYEVNVPVRNGRTSEPKVENPEIRIPRIKPVSESESTDQSQDSEPQSESQSPQQLANGLDGKYVDEFGNILDWDGTVLGRVEGDLPSMVGRPVMPSGQVLDEDGEVAGHVCENYIKPALKPLAGGLKVDDEGNIYDDQGNKIGKLDKPMPTQNGTEKLSKEKEKAQGSGSTGTNNNAKQPGAPRPDELFLDVKSTFDGIQLTIKIPTVFNRNVVTETKSSGSQTETTDSDNR